MALWSAVLFIEVAWPLSPYQHEDAVFPLGPVSADVQPGQTFKAVEPFHVFAAPVKVGGPVDSVAELSVRVRIAGPGGQLVAESVPTQAVSTERPFEMVLFRFPEPVPARHDYFVEFDIPRSTRWPVYLAAIDGDKAPDGRLFMQGAATFQRQDLVYQLLRRQSMFHRLPIWWGAYQGAVIVGIALMGLAHLVSCAAIQGLPARARRRLPHPLVAGLVPPALLAAASFALFFFVL